jgi:exoribonuclease R
MNETPLDLQLQKYKILIDDSHYTKWEFFDANTNAEVCIPELCKINPIERKLFTQDTFHFSTNVDGGFGIIKSAVRTRQYIPGVLMLENNKTYGRTSNKKRLLYRCIPDDKHLPVFLVPYEVKIGFSKLQKNKYVIFKYDNWNDKQPHGQLLQTLGDVDKLEVFYEYQLYCKSLHISLTNFTNKTREQLNKKTADEYIQQIFANPDFKIEDRRKEYIFTIDPKNSADYDDGYNIQSLENGRWKVSIYIANVYIWLETLALWESFSTRVATIYLPDHRRPMLPTILSDTLCSLQQNEVRLAMAMDIIIDGHGKICNDRDIQYKNVLIKVKKNYVYEDPIMLLNDKYYSQLFDISVKMDKSIKNSHDVVAHWMVFMNMHTGNKLIDAKMGVFRSVTYKDANLREVGGNNLDDDAVRVIQTWNNATGRYIVFDEGANFMHEIMNLKSYIHITSPIRRLVDLINQMLLMQNIGLISNMSIHASEFITNWLMQIDYLNISMRSIRKIQTDCVLLEHCFNNPHTMTKSYSGIVFDKIVRDDGTINYMVYLRELKMLSRIVSTQIDIDNYSQGLFKIFLFEDEDKTKKKIRLQFE